MKIRNVYLLVSTVIILLFHQVKISLTSQKLSEPFNFSYYEYLRMPGVTPTTKDEYICFGSPLNTSQVLNVLKFEPLSSANRVHHMILFGCADIPAAHLAKPWDCRHHGVCGGSKILYAWAKNAPATNLPDDVAFIIGGNTTIKYLTLQIHYKDPLPPEEKDDSGLRMLVTQKPQKYKAAIYLLLSSYVDIPPLTEKTHADLNCDLTANTSINIFAYRTHTHSLGTVVTGFKYDYETKELLQIAKGNPQWPQAFYPMGEVVTAKPGDILAARCTFNSSARNRHTYIGATSDDEMCNLYLMYYTDTNGQDDSYCGLETYPELTEQLPADSDEPLPPNPLLEEMTHGENKNKGKEVSYNSLIKGEKSKEGKIHIPDLSDFVSNSRSEERTQHAYSLDVQMPGVTPKRHDEYLCTGIRVNDTEEFILKYQPLASANKAHHILLFGCSDIESDKITKGYWECGHHSVCSGARIFYAWAKNAPATHLPDNVGFRLGKKAGIKFLALQVHYAKSLPPSEKDYSGLKLEITTKPQDYIAGIFLLASGLGTIPPDTPKYNLDINCLVGDTEQADIHLFAYRVHAHTLATVISGYKFGFETKEISELVRGNPQWPQAFYPMETQVIHPNDILHARCTYNSTGRFRVTHIGAQGGDEMCNLYLMYYTDRDKGSEGGGCFMEKFDTLKKALPPNSDQPLPPNPLLEELAHGENQNKDKEITYENTFQNEPIEVNKKTPPMKSPIPRLDEPYPLHPKPVYDYDSTQATSSLDNSEDKLTIPAGRGELEDLVSISREDKQLKSSFHLVEGWGPTNYKLGQVTAVGVDSRGDVVIFHRGDVVWDGGAFQNDVLTDQTRIIAQPTLLHLQRDTGQVMHEWGANFFYMPHGLSIDKEDNIWVTDVGMHQAFKFASGFGEGHPLLTLGKKFEPGSDDLHFCKPTGVAILENGNFFVSDGYCNARIMQFSPEGSFIKQFGSASQNFAGLPLSQPSPGTFFIPHSLTIARDHNEICVADRENGRIQCFDIENGQFSKQFKFNKWGQRIFAAVYSSKGGRLFAVNGPHLLGRFTKLQIFEVNYEEEKIVSTFSPFNQGLSNPHDIAISSDGNELYVVEIGPNKVWKFALAGAKNASKQNEKISTPKIEIQTQQLAEKVDGSNSLSLFSGGWTSVGVSSVILGLLAVPVVVLSMLSIFIWCRRRGSRKFYSGKKNFNGSAYKNGSLNLGSLLNKHHGFEKVATNDLDEDDLDSAESDIEEFSLAAARV